MEKRRETSTDAKEAYRAYRNFAGLCHNEDTEPERLLLDHGVLTVSDGKLLHLVLYFTDGLGLGFCVHRLLQLLLYLSWDA